MRESRLFTWRPAAIRSQLIIKVITISTAVFVFSQGRATRPYKRIYRLCVIRWHTVWGCHRRDLFLLKRLPPQEVSRIQGNKMMSKSKPNDRLIRLSLLDGSSNCHHSSKLSLRFLSLSRVCPSWRNMAWKIFSLARTGIHRKKLRSANDCWLTSGYFGPCWLVF